MIEGITGLIGLCTVLVMHADLLGRLSGMPAPRPWWFGYALDGVNLLSVLLCWAAYLQLGYAIPAALSAGMLTALAMYLLDWAIGRRAGRRRLWLLVPITAWVAALGSYRINIGGALDRLLDHLQPR
jgi:hypothetical protein